MDLIQRHCLEWIGEESDGNYCQCPITRWWLKEHRTYKVIRGSCDEHLEWTKDAIDNWKEVSLDELHIREIMEDWEDANGN